MLLNPKSLEKNEKKPLHPYVLGIVWAIGSYDENTGIMLLRHNNPYFLKAVKDATGTTANVRKSSRNYVLKLSKQYLDINELRSLGWSERNSHERPYPYINEHKDFIRGYFEVHGRISKVRLCNKKNGRYQIQTRLRIFGNERLLQAMNEIISFELGIPEKKLENTAKEHSKVLGYYRFEEVSDIFNWLYDAPENLKNIELETKYREIILIPEPR